MQRRRGLVIAVGVLVSAIGAAMGLSGVSPFGGSGGAAVAAEQRGLVVTLEKEAAGKYGPIVLSGLQATAVHPKPSDCTLPVTTCDLVPLKVILPTGFDPTKHYAYTTITVSWARNTGEEDIDMYMFNRAGKEVGSAATAAHPELARTEQTDLLLVMNAYIGPVSEYTIRAKLTVETLERPFELPPPVLTPGGADFAAPTGSPFVDAGPGSPAFDVPPAPPTVSNSGDPSRSIAAKVDLVPAADALSSVDLEEVANLTRQSQTAGEFRTVSTTEKASTSGVAFWLVVLPLAFLVIGGAWLIRRSPASFKRAS